MHNNLIAKCKYRKEMHSKSPLKMNKGEVIKVTSSCYIGANKRLMTATFAHFNVGLIALNNLFRIVIKFTVEFRKDG